MVLENTDISHILSWYLDYRLSVPVYTENVLRRIDQMVLLSRIAVEPAPIVLDSEETVLLVDWFHAGKRQHYSNLSSSGEMDELVARIYRTLPAGESGPTMRTLPAESELPVAAPAGQTQQKYRGFTAMITLCGSFIRSLCRVTVRLFR